MRTVEERFWPKVEKTDTCWNWAGYLMPKGYGQFTVGGRHQYAHRVSYEIEYGAIPSGLFIDHMCHNRACVNPDHLRVVTSAQNLQNRAGPQSNGKSGVRGVSWERGRRKWRAQVGHGREQFYVGLFDTLAEAEAAAVAKRKELHTHNDLDRREAA